VQLGIEGTKGEGRTGTTHPAPTALKWAGGVGVPSRQTQPANRLPQTASRKLPTANGDELCRKIRNNPARTGAQVRER
jgi:hypothetical protein